LRHVGVTSTLRVRREGGRKGGREGGRGVPVLGGDDTVDFDCRLRHVGVTSTLRVRREGGREAGKQGGSSTGIARE